MPAPCRLTLGEIVDVLRWIATEGLDFRDGKYEDHASLNGRIRQRAKDVIDQFDRDARCENSLQLKRNRPALPTGLNHEAVSKMSVKHPAHHVDESKNGDGSFNLTQAAQHAQQATENILNGHTKLYDMIQHTLSDGKVARVFITSE